MLASHAQQPDKAVHLASSPVWQCGADGSGGADGGDGGSIGGCGGGSGSGGCGGCMGGSKLVASRSSASGDGDGDGDCDGDGDGDGEGVVPSCAAQTARSPSSTGSRCICLASTSGALGQADRQGCHLPELHM